jgi:hypothetical protein
MDEQRFALTDDMVYLERMVQGITSPNYILGNLKASQVSNGVKVRIIVREPQ